MPQKDLFIAELIFTLTSQVIEDIDPEPARQVEKLPNDCFATQCIIGDYEAFTAIYAEPEVLLSFASAYAHFNVDEDLRDEILGDFLNLNNGRFVVSLSDTLSLECSLSVPEIGPKENNVYYESTYIIPVTFSFGTVNFVFSE